ncbi:SDR family NAD(P)-dependent oxidoreductase [Bordetella tumulicola]|uniref:SDR family NAD(P)-dependent oxidoreductase n=1 Tax=Bordetella tumulicola TaxID=1649133 RepID=UPI0039F0E999
MKTSTSSRVALVSGASRGIGLAIARELLEHGWRVSAGTRGPIEALAGQSSDRYHWARFDAFDPATESAWVQAASAHFGQIDAMVHNAGILSRQSVIDATSQEFDEIFEVNVKSPMRLTQCAWPHLKAVQNGKVIVVASLAGKRVRAAEGGLYSMSKAAALMLAHSLRHAGDVDGIRCTAVCPGFVATDMADGVEEGIKAQLTQPKEIATIVRMALELPASASVAEIPVSWKVEAEY